MYKVRIPSNNFHIERQLPSSFGNVWGNCEFIFDDTQEYDYFVVLDSLSEEIVCNVDKQHRLLFLGEPPYIKQYNQQYFKQFGHIFTCNKALIKKGYAKKLFPLLPWMLGMSFEENSHNSIGCDYLPYDYFTSNQNSPNRINKACLITSNKTITKGHRDRVHFANYIIEHCSDIIDVYGNGYKSIPDKYDVLKKYEYAIIIENCQYSDYWTEKIGDCYLAGCYPIYHGCPNINDYFDERSYTLIDICNIESSIEVIRKTIMSDTYIDAKEALIQSKSRVLNQYNIFPQINEIVSRLNNNKPVKNSSKCRELLYPLKWTLYDKLKMELVRKYNLRIGF